MFEATYGVVPAAGGRVWSAPNPAQGMFSTFTAEAGVRIEGSDGKGAWGLSLELEGWGRSGALVPVKVVEPVVHGRRVEYRRGPLTEWFVNDPRGLEQGFTLAERPAESGALEIALAVGDTFAVEAPSGERHARFTERGTGRSIHYSGLRAWDSAERELEASIAVDGQRLTICVGDEGAVYPLQVDPWLSTLEGLLLPSVGQNSDHFGYSVAIDGDTAIVGANEASHGGKVDAGAAYVFVRSGTTWSEQAMLTASDAAQDDHFGESVAIWGDAVVVGAPGFIVGNGEGQAYVFVRSGTTWSEQAKLTASDAASDDHFGTSVAIWWDTVVVGTPYKSGDLPFGGRGLRVRAPRNGLERATEAHRD